MQCSNLDTVHSTHKYHAFHRIRLSGIYKITVIKIAWAIILLSYSDADYENKKCIKCVNIYYIFFFVCNVATSMHITTLHGQARTLSNCFEKTSLKADVTIPESRGNSNASEYRSLIISPQLSLHNSREVNSSAYPVLIAWVSLHGRWTAFVCSFIFHMKTVPFSKMNVFSVGFIGVDGMPQGQRAFKV